MRGLMMDMPLSIAAIMRHAELNHAAREIVSVTSDLPRHRYTYSDAFRRCRQLANAFARLGIARGDRVATLAWNDHRHFEAYYAVSCSGAVLHTVNPRLFADQVAFVLNHGGAGCVLTDPKFVPLLEELAPRLESVRHFVVLTDAGHMPDTALPNVMDYESLLAAAPDDFDWPLLDEACASAICYTSGTTGEPRGVVYSHRSTVLHAMAIALPDVMNVSATDTVLPIVPMFHVNAWGTPYAAPLAGARLVLPGPKVGDRAALYTLLEEECVTRSLAVPTVWRGLLRWMDEHERTLSSLEEVVIGGAACPAHIIEALGEHGVDVRHSWGMTEMSPVGTCNAPTPESLAAPDPLAVKLQQGRAVFGVEMKIVDDDGCELPRDGQARGTLKVRGPWVAAAYYAPDGSTPAVDADGWFDTGDVASIDGAGFLTICDRNKDLIKSGGEWISSIELENIAAGHRDVAEAAVIAVPHSKWTERPLLIVVARPDATIDRRTLRAWYRGKVAGWSVPDDIVVIDEMPHTATGKISKRVLRERFSGYRLPDADLA